MLNCAADSFIPTAVCPSVLSFNRLTTIFVGLYLKPRLALHVTPNVMQHSPWCGDNNNNTKKHSKTKRLGKWDESLFKRSITWIYNVGLEIGLKVPDLIGLLHRWLPTCLSSDLVFSRDRDRGTFKESWRFTVAATPISVITLISMESNRCNDDDGSYECFSFLFFLFFSYKMVETFFFRFFFSVSFRLFNFFSFFFFLGFRFWRTSSIMCRRSCTRLRKQRIKSNLSRTGKTLSSDRTSVVRLSVTLSFQSFW